MYPTFDSALSFLVANALPYTIHEHGVSQAVADAREKLSIQPDRLLKTIVIKDKVGHYYLVVVQAA